MNYRGTVKLVKADHVFHEFTYEDRESRKRIIERWRRLYGMKFEEFELVISPMTIEDLKPYKRVVETKAQHLRPPAVYNSRKHLYDYGD